MIKIIGSIGFRILDIIIQLAKKLSAVGHIQHLLFLLLCEPALADEAYVLNQSVSFCEEFLLSEDAEISVEGWEVGHVKPHRDSGNLAPSAETKHRIWIAKSKAVAFIARSDFLDGIEVYRECTIVPINPIEPEILGGILEIESQWAEKMPISHKSAKKAFDEIFTTGMVEIGALDMGLSKSFQSCSENKLNHTVIFTAFNLFIDVTLKWKIKAQLIQEPLLGNCE